MSTNLRSVGAVLRFAVIAVLIAAGELGKRWPGQ
jgi:hypothetical protein